MYAVFKTGGKQYRAAEGDRIKIERLEAAEGDDVEFDQVLVVGQGGDLQVGQPLVDGGRVKAKVISQARSKKVDVVKFKRRKNYRRLHGHRQHYTLVEITGISGG